MTASKLATQNAFCWFGIKRFRLDCRSSHGPEYKGGEQAGTQANAGGISCRFGRSCYRADCYIKHLNGRDVDRNAAAGVADLTVGAFCRHHRSQWTWSQMRAIMHFVVDVAALKKQEKLEWTLQLCC